MRPLRLCTHVFLIVVWVAIFVAPSISRAAEPAQKVMRIGFVSPGPPGPATRAFWDRLRELNYVEGQNLIVERRWAEGRYERLPALMEEVVRQNVAVIVTISTPAAVAAKNATSTIPIVAVEMGDPVGTGLAVSLAHPGGNLTGLSLGFVEGMAGKWLELLQEMVPRLSKVAVIENPDNPVVKQRVKELEAVAPNRGVTLRLFEVREPGALDGAFQQARRTSQAVLVVSDPVTVTHRRQITTLAAQYRLPTMYNWLEFADDADGLMAYAPNRSEMFRRAADYVDKILKGATPADLPIEQPTQYQLVVNLKTAKALGITIPESIMLRADEVIR